MRRAAVRYCYRKGVPGKIRIRAATIFQAPAIFRRAIHLEGALREIGEELGIHAEAEELRDLGLLEKVSHGVFYGKPFHDHEVSAVYLYTKPVEAEKLHLQESEVEAVRWMDLKECQKAVREGSIPNCIDIRELEMIEKAWFAGEKTKNEE